MRHSKGHIISACCIFRNKHVLMNVSGTWKISSCLKNFGIIIIHRKLIYTHFKYLNWKHCIYFKVNYILYLNKKYCVSNINSNWSIIQIKLVLIPDSELRLTYCGIIIMHEKKFPIESLVIHLFWVHIKNINILQWYVYI